MPHPSAPSVVLFPAQREQLESLLRAGSTPQALVFRVRLVLRAADAVQPSNRQIAAEFSCTRKTVSLWRRRDLAQGLAGLQDALRSGRPRSFSPLGTRSGDLAGLVSAAG